MMEENNNLTNLSQKAEQNAIILSDELKVTYNKCIISSNATINNMRNQQFDFEKEHKKIYDVMEILLENLNSYDQLDIENNINSIDKDIFIKYKRDMELNYRQLNNAYYKFMIDKMSQQTEKIQKDIRGTQSNHDKLKKEFHTLNGKMESLGATFLNIVLTISITSTMVTVLLNASPKYSLAIILGCAWLLLSSIIFVGAYFKNDNQKSTNNKTAMIIYIVLSIITLIAFGYGIFADDKTIKEIDNPDCNSQNTSILIK